MEYLAEKVIKQKTFSTAVKKGAVRTATVAVRL
jgi:hypothetical protein